MSAFLCLFKKEFRACFYSPVAYVVMFFFWVLTGANFIWLLSQLTEGESLTLAAQLMFGGPVLTFAIPVIVPLITMRLFAEERKLGTLEALLTTSIRVRSLVAAKFAGAFVFYMTLWLPVIVYAVIQQKLCPADVNGFPDIGAMWGGALGVSLVGGLYISVGVFMSSLTSNQIVAAIGSFALLFGLSLILTILAYNAPNPSVKEVAQYFSSFAHMMDFSRGIVDSRMIVMYVTHAAWFLFATGRIIEGKRS